MLWVIFGIHKPLGHYIYLLNVIFNQILTRDHAEPIFFTLTIPIWEIVCHMYIGKISVMDHNNSVFLYERGFIQSEMGILWQCIEKIWSWKNFYWNSVFRSMAKTSLGKRLYSQKNGDFRPCNSITYLKKKKNIHMGIMLPG